TCSLAQLRSRSLVPTHKALRKWRRQFRSRPPAERRSRGGFMRRVLVSMCAATFLTAVPAAASDPVLDWMKVANDAVIATATSPLVTGRNVALVSSAVFDAVNGIDRRFQ